MTAYIGTDHALTESDALTSMKDDGVSVRLLRRYNGIYHPKVAWFVAETGGQLLVGSNNLTFDGLRSNIEFATLTQLTRVDENLNHWHEAVHAASDEATDPLIGSYAREQQSFGEARARARVAGAFTWSERSSGGTPPATAAPPPSPPRRRARWRVAGRDLSNRMRAT